MKKFYVFLVIGILLSLEVWAQDKYNFTEQYTFETNKKGEKVQFSVFLEPKTGTWLLTKDDTFNGEVDDINQWILKPNGEVVLLADDEFGKPVKLIFKNYGLKNIKKTFTNKPIGKGKQYGKNKYGWPTFMGYTYAISAGRMQAKVTLFKGKNNYLPLYAYNFCLDVENHIPGFSKVNYSEILPKIYLVLEDEVVKLISVSPTEYYIEIPK